jgi:hypothetical protein
MAAATAVKFDVTSNSRGSRKDLEREAVFSFRELERAEKAAGDRRAWQAVREGDGRPLHVISRAIVTFVSFDTKPS